MSFKIVHSFWSKPAFHEKQDYYNSRKTAGFLNMRYFLLSSCLSCLTAKRHHGKIELRTDDPGKRMLIDKLGLPYDDVFTDLEELNNSDHKLWVLAKLKAFKAQKKPFIHIDNDVYLWKELFPDTEKNLIAQSTNRIFDSYEETLKDILQNFDFLPKCMQSQRVSRRTLEVNTGVIGGQNIDFFQEYCEAAEEFVTKNTASLKNIDMGTFNTVLEQYLFTCLARFKKLKVKYAVRYYTAIVQFHLVPLVDKYIHLIGTAKQNQFACEQLELRLCHEFPREYIQVTKAMKKHFPETYEQNLLSPDRKKRLLKNISYLYKNDIKQICRKKIRLADDTYLHEEASAAGSQPDIFLDTNIHDPLIRNVRKLSGQDIALAYFDKPVSIDDILNEIRKQQYAGSAELKQQSSQLLDFVTRKIILDGVLDFV